MSSRHTRRKAAKAKQFDKLVSLAQAERARQIATIVKANKSAPIEREYGKSASLIADVKAHVYLGYREPRASGGMSGNSVNGLKAKGAKFTRADSLEADDAAILGERLSGRAIREAAEKRALAKIAALKAAKR